MAGAGCGLAVLGVLVLSFDGLDGSGGDDGSQVPGILLCLAVLAAGIVLLTKAPKGALRTAGSVATVAAIPPLLFFLTFDEGGFPPYSTEAILGVSAAAWLVLHLVGPAAGRPLPLGAGLVAAWLFTLQVTEEPFTAPFDILLLFAFSFEASSSFEDEPFVGDGFGSLPDLATMAGISLVAGFALVVLGRHLDRRGERGRGTPVAAAALPMLVAGCMLLIEELEVAGSGVVLAIVGAVVAGSGATRGRRATTWIGSLAAVVGVGMVVGDVAGDSATGFGIAAIIAGAGVVVGTHFLTAAFGEPDELVAGLSTFSVPRTSVGPPGSAPPPPEPPDAWAPPSEPPPA